MARWGRGWVVLPVALLPLAACATPTARPVLTPSSAAVPGIPVPPGAQEAVVVRGVDGDTTVLRGIGVGPLGPGKTKVRLLLIDTPEVFGQDECFGAQASARTAELLPDGARVRVEADRDRLDRFDRTLLHLWTAAGVNVEQELLRGGFARVLVVRPNVRYLAAYERTEAQARAAGEGLWAACPGVG